MSGILPRTIGGMIEPLPGKDWNKLDLRLVFHSLFTTPMKKETDIFNPVSSSGQNKAWGRTNSVFTDLSHSTTTRSWFFLWLTWEHHKGRVWLFPGQVFLAAFFPYYYWHSDNRSVSCKKCQRVKLFENQVSLLFLS